MRVEILNTGTELLLGNTENTHAAWFGRELFKLGLRIARQTTVPDGAVIRQALDDAMARADVVLVTGGLGPTSDDVSRECTAAALGVALVTDETARRSMEAYFAIRGWPLAGDNLKQALVPLGSEALPNAHGTAPGVYVPPQLSDRAQCALFLLPGPPRELYPMFHSAVVPRLRALAGGTTAQQVLELKFTGIGESTFHQGIDAQLAAIPALEYGYCAHIGEVDLRLIGPPGALASARAIVLGRFEPFLVSDDGASLEATVVRILTEQRRCLAVAESCTGGLVCNRLTDVPGASAVFTHGWVTYANAAKLELLGVVAADLASHGAVSETVACQMAAGAMRVSGADLAVAVTGIAGPAGGSPDKPVGTAWIGLAVREHAASAFRVYHPRNRQDFKLAVSQAALEAVRRALVGLGLTG